MSEHHYDKYDDDDYDNDKYDDNDNDNDNDNDMPPLEAYNLNPNSELDIKKKEFDGSIGIKNDWIKCLYCEKYHPVSMHLADIGYCGHCWGWLNTEQLKLSDGIYTGTTNTIDQVKTFLKQTYPLHPKTCTMVDCIYNKITQSHKINKLHWDFCVELGFVKEDKNKDIKNDSLQKQTNNGFTFKKSKRYPKINYTLSSVTI